MKNAAIAVGALIALLILAGLVFLYSGAYNIAATAGHTGITRWALNTLQERSVEAHAASVPEPPQIDPAMLQHGFEHFHEMCVACHGAPGVERGEYGQGMTPTPPDLAEEAEEWSEREIFWITKHGIKIAGMPAFGPTHSDAELWGMAAFVKTLPEMTDAEYARMATALEVAGGAGHTHTGAAGHTHAPGEEHSHEASGDAAAAPADSAAEAGDHTHPPGTPPHTH